MITFQSNKTLQSNYNGGIKPLKAWNCQQAQISVWTQFYKPGIAIALDLNQNSQAVKKRVCRWPSIKSQNEKRCEIKGGGQEMAVMVG